MAPKLGDFLVREHLEAALTQPKAFLKAGLGFDLDLTKINSITAYGTSYAPDPEHDSDSCSSKTGLDLRKAFDATIVKRCRLRATRRRSRRNWNLKMERPFYSVHDQVYVSFPQGGAHRGRQIAGNAEKRG